MHEKAHNAICHWIPFSTSLRKTFAKNIDRWLNWQWRWSWFFSLNFEWFSFCLHFKPKIAKLNEFIQFFSKWSRNKIKHPFIFSGVTKWNICLICSISGVEWAEKISPMQIILRLSAQEKNRRHLPMKCAINFRGKLTHSMRRIEREPREQKDDLSNDAVNASVCCSQILATF